MRAWWRRRWRSGGDPTRAAPDAAATTDGATELLRRVRAIELRARRLVDDLFLGEYHAVFRGRGIEFDELRPYVVGDDVRSIDLEVVRPHRRAARPPLSRGSRPHSPLRRRRQRLPDGRRRRAVQGQPRRRALRRLPRWLPSATTIAPGSCSSPAPPNATSVPLAAASTSCGSYARCSPPGPRRRGTDLGAALEYLTGVQRRRATLFVISDFLTEGYARALRAASRRFDIIAVRIREPLDEQLPAAGLVRLASAESGPAYEVDSDDPAVREAYAARVRAIDAERERLFGELGIDEIRIVTGEDYVRALLAFFRRRARAVA